MIQLHTLSTVCLQSGVDQWFGCRVNWVPSAGPGSTLFSGAYISDMVANKLLAIIKDSLYDK